MIGMGLWKENWNFRFKERQPVELDFRFLLSYDMLGGSGIVLGFLVMTLNSARFHLFVHLFFPSDNLGFFNIVKKPWYMHQY